MVSDSLENTIYNKFLDAESGSKFHVIHDRRIVGNRNLTSPKWQKGYVDSMLQGIGHRPFVFLVVLADEEADEWIGRFISFEEDIYRLLWIAENYKSTLGALDDYAGIILN